MTEVYNGILRYSRLPKLASSRSRSRSIRRRVSSVILPSRSSAWMNLRSATISSRVSSVPAAETSCSSGSSESGNWLARDLVPRAQQLDDLVGEFAVVGDGVERFQRGIERLAPRRDFRFMLGDMFVAAVLRDAEPSHHRRQPEPEADQRDEDDAEGDEQDQVAIGKRVAVRQRERQRQRGGQRHRAAHAGERDHERRSPWRRRIALAQALAQQPRQIGRGIDPGEARDDDDDRDQRGREQDVVERKRLRFLVQRRASGSRSAGTAGPRSGRSRGPRRRCPAGASPTKSTAARSSSYRARRRRSRSRRSRRNARGSSRR